MPRAGRATDAICAASAAIPANERLTAAMARASAAEPATGRPSAARAAVISAASAALAIPATASATASGACRPTTPAWISSSRPASSSARVCRTTRKMATRDARIAAHTPYRQAVRAPTELAYGLPYRKRKAGFWLAVTCSWARVTGV